MLKISKPTGVQAKQVRKTSPSLLYCERTDLDATCIGMTMDRLVTTVGGPRQLMLKVEGLLAYANRGDYQQGAMPTYCEENARFIRNVMFPQNHSKIKDIFQETLWQDIDNTVNLSPGLGEKDQKNMAEINRHLLVHKINKTNKKLRHTGPVNEEIRGEEEGDARPKSLPTKPPARNTRREALSCGPTRLQRLTFAALLQGKARRATTPTNVNSFETDPCSSKAGKNPSTKLLCC